MKKIKKKNDWAAYLYILPLLLLSFVLVYYCIIDTIFVSFTDWDGMTDEFGFVGLANYAKMIKDQTFWTAVLNNLIFFVGTVFVQAFLGFILARSFPDPIFSKRSILCRSPWLLQLSRQFSRSLWILPMAL